MLNFFTTAELYNKQDLGKVWGKLKALQNYWCPVFIIQISDSALKNILPIGTSVLFYA